MPRKTTISEDHLSNPEGVSNEIESIAEKHFIFWTAPANSKGMKINVGSPGTGRQILMSERDKLLKNKSKVNL